LQQLINKKQQLAHNINSSRSKAAKNKKA